jgi:hypothetical protein
MKKVLLSFVMLLAAVAASAQGTWEKTITEADELKGIEGGEAYIYTVPQMGSFVFWGFDKFQYRLVSDEAQFNTKTVSGMSVYYTGLEAFVGIYDDNDKLIEKFKMWLDKEDNKANSFVRTRNAGGMSNPVGQKGKVKKIFKALQSGKGYVRIVCERFNRSDFDIKITPFKE